MRLLIQNEEGCLKRCQRVKSKRLIGYVHEEKTMNETRRNETREHILILGLERYKKGDRDSEF